jgi:hypothetical protein
MAESRRTDGETTRERDQRVGEEQQQKDAMMDPGREMTRADGADGAGEYTPDPAQASLRKEAARFGVEPAPYTETAVPPQTMQASTALGMSQPVGPKAKIGIQTAEGDVVRVDAPPTTQQLVYEVRIAKALESVKDLEGDEKLLHLAKKLAVAEAFIARSAGENGGFKRLNWTDLGRYPYLVLIPTEFSSEDDISVRLGTKVELDLPAYVAQQQAKAKEARAATAATAKEPTRAT